MTSIGFLRIAAAALAIVPAACGGGGAAAIVSACQDDAAFVLKPRSYQLVAGGGHGVGTVHETDPFATNLKETNTCSGVATVAFSALFDNADVEVTPLAPGTCRMRIEDSSHCLDTSITVASAP